MKTITIHVPEDTYRAFQEHAARSNHSASELIRNAMDDYYRSHLSQGGSIFDHEPISVGRVLSELGPDDDLLGEMIS